MHWRRVAAVQEVSAIIVRGPGVVEQMLAQMSVKSPLFGDVTIDHGEDWIAVFAASLQDETGAADAILPALDGIPLYAEAAGWWLPVGVEIDAPVQAHPALRQALAAAHDVRGPAIVMPRFANDGAPTDVADVYAIGAGVPLLRYRLAAA